ncbi:MAG TPA: hypothetical protein VHY84_27390 [Bryobacteraceae bacterium]|jgi:hypothetical protein|nr:hypothetical protein [Bryobacteraceae bacterium]
MNFAKTYSFESVSYPGVVITLMRIGPKRRAEIELSVSKARARQRELSTWHESTRQTLVAVIDASPKDAEGKPIEAQLLPESLALAMELQAIVDEAEALVCAQIHPAFVRAALKAFGGPEALTYEGKPATAELLCEYGPDELFNEVVAAITGNGYINAEAARNLSSPSTSDGQGDGEATNTTAPAASPDANILPAAA